LGIYFNPKNDVAHIHFIWHYTLKSDISAYSQSLSIKFQATNPSKQNHLIHIKTYFPQH